MRKVDDGGENIHCSGGYMLFRGVICCSRGLYGCSGGLCTVQGFYAVQEGYIDAQEGCILFRGLYAVQEGYMDVQEGYMLKKIMMFILATNVVASQPPERPPLVPKGLN